MRLAQLARKLAIRPSVIVEFLTKQNIQIGEESNTRLEDDHVSLIMQKFAPALAAEVEAELAFEKEADKELLSNKETETIIEQPSPEKSTDSELSTFDSEPLPEKTEVIKAPKVELSGLKVLGKIELPESKKKEPPLVPEQSQIDQVDKEEIMPATEVERKPRQENRKPYPGNKRETSDQRPKKNPIALQREREAFEADKKRRAQIKLEKEKRTQHYLKKVKVVAPVKSVRPTEDQPQEIAPAAPAPKTLWGRFMKWLNT